MKISNRIKQLRVEKEYTQKQLSDMIGLTPKMISFYENGARIPPIDILLKFVQIFDVSSDYLLGLTDKRHSQEDSEWRYPPILNRLGSILKKYREDKGISEANFAKKLDIATETYTGIEIGKYIPSLDIIKKLSEITGYDINYFTGAIDHISVPSNEIFNIGSKEISVLYSESDCTFKERLEKFCLMNDITNDNCEEKLYISHQDFIDIKYNRMPTLSELLKLSYAFNVSMDYLIGRTNTKFISLSSDELELLLNYRDCSEETYKDNIRKRAKDLSIASLNNASVAADSALKKTGTDNQGK